VTMPSSASASACTSSSFLAVNVSRRGTLGRWGSRGGGVGLDEARDWPGGP
jgi:hypothetical protein